MATPPSPASPWWRQWMRRGVQTDLVVDPSAPTLPNPDAVETQPSGDPDALAPAEVGALPSGSIIAGYRIERLLGRGALGATYLALDPETETAVAIKTIALAREFDGPTLAEVRRRFSLEAAAASRLVHPDIVSIYGAGEEQGLCFIVMEALTGSDLSRYTRPARLLPEPVVFRIGQRVAEALAFAHGKGVVHRDVKPANVVVDLTTHQVKLTDFGVARLTDAASTRTGLVLGTPSFMAPEQLEGRSPDARSDLYSLGVMLFQLLTGQLPYESTSLGQLLRAIASEEPQNLRSLRPDLPQAAADLLAALLNKSAAARPGNGMVVSLALQRIEAEWDASQRLGVGS